MQRSVQLNLPPTKVQSLSLAGETAAPANGKGLSQAEESSLTSLLAESVVAVGCTEKEAAIAQGYEPAYWSRVKAGEKQAHLERLARLPETVQREFVKRYARQLRMEVREPDAKARAVAELIEVAARALREVV